MYKKFIDDPILLKIDIKGVDIHSDPNTYNGGYWTSDNIGPDKIQMDDIKRIQQI